jgi:ribosomal protein S27E
MEAGPSSDRFVCRIEEIENQRELFSIQAGAVCLGRLRGRPCLFVTTRTMRDWVEERWGESSDLPLGSAVAYCFESESDRDAYIRDRAWDRLVDGYLKDEMWELFTATAPGNASREDFEIAYVDAIDAIRELPCRECGKVAWPVITKPEGGSAEWWDDPSAGFSCRVCGMYLADPFAYPAIRQPSREYPHEGVVDRSKLGPSDDVTS